MKKGGVLLSLSEATSVKMKTGKKIPENRKRVCKAAGVPSCEMLWSEVRKSPP